MSSHHIDNDRYQELFYFCKGYQSRQQEINNLRGLTAPNMDGMPKGNKVGSQTEAKAIRIEKLTRENELIEQAAIEADSCIYQHIIKNVTLGIGYEYLRCPYSRGSFYDRRRKFYKILSELR